VGHAVRRERNLELLEDVGKLAPVLHQVHLRVGGAKDLDPVLLKALAEFNRRLPAELQDHTLRLLQVDHILHPLPEDRLEVELVRHVEVGRDGLRVAVEHEGLVTHLLRRLYTVDARVVKLNALPNPVGAGAEDEHLVSARDRAFVDRLVAGVVVGRLGRKLARTGVDDLVGGGDVALFAVSPDLAVAHVVRHKVRDLLVGEAGALGRAEIPFAHLTERRLPDLLFQCPQVRNLIEEPRVDLRDVVHLFHARALPKRMAHVQQGVPMGHLQALAHRVRVRVRAVGPEARVADLQALPGLLQALVEGTADGHDLADRFHLCGEFFVDPLEFVEVEAGNFGHYVVERGLEAGARVAGDLVGQLVERVADGELGGDLRNRVAGGLRRQGRGAAHPRVDLDHNHAPGARLEGELDVAAAGKGPDRVHGLDRRVAHPLKLLVGQRLLRRHSHRVAGVHAHRRHVLDGGDDDDVVVGVAEQLQLVLFPPEEALVDQDLVGRRELQAAGHHLLKVALLPDNAPARAAERVGGPDDDRQSAQFLRNLFGLQQALGRVAARLVEPDLVHQRPKLLAVLGDLNRVDVDPDHLNAFLLPEAVLF